MDKVNFGINVDAGDVFKELKASMSKFKENRTYDRTAYGELLSKYTEAIELIENQKDQINRLETQLNSNKLPTGEEIDNLAKMMDVVGILNDKMPELEKLQKSVDKLNRKK